jgi:hypothetical protein
MVEHDDDFEGEEYDEQVEQMVLDNGVLLHSIANLLLRKGVITQEELDGELDRLYSEIEAEDDDSEERE